MAGAVLVSDHRKAVAADDYIGIGIGSDVMKRIAAPMVGGIITSLIMELTVYPAIFYTIKKRELQKNIRIEGEG